MSPAERFDSMPCENCGGRGADPGSLSATEPDECPVCLGSGYLLTPDAVEEIAQVERKRPQPERLPAGYFEEQAWRYGS